VSSWRRCKHFDLNEVRAQSWYKVRSYELVNPTFKISLLKEKENLLRCVCNTRERGFGESEKNRENERARLSQYWVMSRIGTSHGTRVTYLWGIDIFSLRLKRHICHTHIWHTMMHMAYTHSHMCIPHAEYVCHMNHCVDAMWNDCLVCVCHVRSHGTRVNDSYGTHTHVAYLIHR